MVTLDATVEFPNLFQVFGGYLHQDFNVEYASPDEALRAAAGEASELIGGAILEIDELLGRGLQDAGLETIIEQLTAGYAPELDGWGAHEWLSHARAILQAGAPS